MAAKAACRAATSKGGAAMEETRNLSTPFCDVSFYGTLVMARLHRRADFFKSIVGTLMNAEKND